MVEIAALVVAAAWGFYVFVYQERIKPASELPILQPQLSVHHEMLSAQKEYVEVQFNLKNTSGASAELDGMVVTVYGRRMATTSSERIESPLPSITELNRTLTISAPTLLYSFYDSWTPFGASSKKAAILHGGSDFRERIAFGITPRFFGMLKITYAYCYSRPGSGPWPVHRTQRPDGSYFFSGISSTQLSSNCHGQSLGEYFPV